MSTNACCHCDQPSPRRKKPLILLAALLLAYLLWTNDMTGLLQQNQLSNSLWIVLLVGLVASISTCLALTGGVIIAYTDLTVTSDDTRATQRSHQAHLHLGRILGFLLGGAILGLLGQKISYTLGFTTWSNALLGLVLLYIGLRMGGLLPVAMTTTPWIDKRQNKLQQKGKQRPTTMAVGALTFFIPCGFTQMVQVMALGAGSRLTGAVMMGAFALGTLPGLLLLGVGTSRAKHKRIITTIVATILIAFSLYSIRGAFVLSGARDVRSHTPPSPVQYELDHTTQTITLTHDGSHLQPSHTTLQAGKNYQIIITPTIDGLGCMSTIVAPTIDKHIYPVLQDQDITYHIANAQPGHYTFVCSSMGMEQGKIIVR